MKPVKKVTPGASAGTKRINRDKETKKEQSPDPGNTKGLVTFQALPYLCY